MKKSLEESLEKSIGLPLYLKEAWQDGNDRKPAIVWRYVGSVVWEIEVDDEPETTNDDVQEKLRLGMNKRFRCNNQHMAQKLQSHISSAWQTVCNLRSAICGLQFCTIL